MFKHAFLGSCYQLASQNHSRSKEGRDLWVHPSQPLLQQVQPEHGAQVLLEVSKEESPQPLWAVHASALPSAKHQSAAACVQREPPMLWFLPSASCPGSRHHCREPSSVLWVISLQVFTKTADISLSLLTGEVLQALHSSPACPHLNCAGEPRTGASAPGAATQMLSRREGPPPLTCRKCWGTCYGAAAELIYKIKAPSAPTALGHILMSSSAWLFSTIFNWGHISHSFNKINMVLSMLHACVHVCSVLIHAAY